MTKSLMISIQPKHLVNILNGNKTLELRKTVPKDFKGWVYIYCTKDKKDILYKYKDKYYTQHHLTFTDCVEVLNGKVVARFWFDEYETMDTDYSMWVISPKRNEEILEQSCLTWEEADKYANYKTLYVWHIKKLEIFDEPKELSDFYKATLYFSWRLQKAPQSWQYVYTKEL